MHICLTPERDSHDEHLRLQSRPVNFPAPTGRPLKRPCRRFHARASMAVNPRIPTRIRPPFLDTFILTTYIPPTHDSYDWIQRDARLDLNSSILLCCPAVSYYEIVAGAVTQPLVARPPFRGTKQLVNILAERVYCRVDAREWFRGAGSRHV
jgi:hypothetical protein